MQEGSRSMRNDLEAKSSTELRQMKSLAQATADQEGFTAQGNLARALAAKIDNILNLRYTTLERASR